MENKDFCEQLAELLSGLTDEQKQKAEACETPKEQIALLGELGVEIPDKRCPVCRVNMWKVKKRF